MPLRSSEFRVWSQRVHAAYGCGLSCSASSSRKRTRCTSRNAHFRLLGNLTARLRRVKSLLSRYFRLPANSNKIQYDSLLCPVKSQLLQNPMRVEAIMTPQLSLPLLCFCSTRPDPVVPPGRWRILQSTGSSPREHRGGSRSRLAACRRERAWCGTLPSSCYHLRRGGWAGLRSRR